MDLNKEHINKLTKKLLIARLNLLSNYGFYGLLLMNTKIGLNKECKTACTDGKKHIWFGIDFLEGLNEKETEFVLMHEIGHIVFRWCERLGDKDARRYNIAQDIVINSNILLASGGNLDSISVNGVPSMHQVPNGNEGHLFTSEQVYEMIRGTKYVEWDDHSKLVGDNKKAVTEEENDEWMQNFRNVCEVIKNRKNFNIPGYAERFLLAMNKSKLDWRRLLAEFVEEDIMDYSFSPPDRRFDGDFFLPDFNDTEPNEVKNILFMIDTSASMSDEQISEAYSEIKGAIDQFAGKLQGWLGFFDAEVVEPKPFEDEESFITIRPIGGGGTRFDIIFDYINKQMKDNLPVSIIIMTDGYAPYPKEPAAMGIPTMWLIVREENDDNKASMPPWGRVLSI